MKLRNLGMDFSIALQSESARVFGSEIRAKKQIKLNRPRIQLVVFLKELPLLLLLQLHF